MKLNLSELSKNKYTDPQSQPTKATPTISQKKLLLQTFSYKHYVNPQISLILFLIDISAYIILGLVRFLNTIISAIQAIFKIIAFLYSETRFAFFGKTKKGQFLALNLMLLHIFLLLTTFLLINNLYQTAKSLNYLSTTKHPPLLISQTDGYLKQDLQIQILQNITPRDNFVAKEPIKKARYFVYTVRPGDTIYTIALRYGINTNTLIAANSLRNVNYLKIGQKLRVPAQNGILYKVKRGDTLASIAKKYKISYNKLLAANNLSKSTALKPGEIILVPGIIPKISSNTPKKTSYRYKTTYLGGSYFRGISGSCSFALKYSGSGLRNYKVRPAIHYVSFIKYNPVAGPFRIGSGFAGYRWGTYYWHSGIDYIAAYGTPIIAVADGIIDRIGIYGGYNYGYGNYIRIYHPQVGLYTLYAHMSRYATGIRIGTHVRAGQVIGYVGHTGIAYGNHVHFEVIDKNRLRYNPSCFK